MTSNSIALNVQDIRRRIADAANGENDKITLVAASKTQPADVIQEAVRAGVDAVGENRVQELLKKDAQGAYKGVPLHFIGRLQKNKVANLIGRVALIQSVDSLELAKVINDCAGKRGVRQSVLAQVNIAMEDTKGGFAPDNVIEALKSMSVLPHIRICGLMCIPPPIRSNNDISCFSLMRQLYVAAQEANIEGTHIETLSMGMSDDFELAVRAGANMVRIGSAIFGAREKA